MVFQKNQNGKTLLIGDSKSLAALNKVLAKPESTQYFKETGRLQDALRLVEQSSDSFHEAITSALETLKLAQGYMHNIDTHYVSDSDLLSEIVSLSKSMRISIMAKMDDED